MRTIPRDVLVATVQKTLSGEEYAAWREKIFTPLPDTFEAVRARLCDEAYPAFVQMAVINGCKRAEVIEEYHGKIFAVLEAVYAEYQDLRIFQASTKDGEARAATDTRIAPVHVEWETERKCRIYKSKLLCYCDEVSVDVAP